MMWTHGILPLVLSLAGLTCTGKGDILPSVNSQAVLNTTKTDEVDSLPDIIVGIHKVRPEIHILDADGTLKWKWVSSTNLETQFGCTAQNVVHDLKWTEDMTRIAAIVGTLALIISHAPGKEHDKQVLFGVCEDSGANAHALEILPGDRLALVAKRGFSVYDTSAGIKRSPKRLHTEISPWNIHGLVWDDEEQLLWAAGGDKPADNMQGKSYGILQCYVFGEEQLALVDTYRMPSATQLGTEWGWGTGFGNWWDLPHDLVPVPAQRKFLVPTDMDVYVFDMSSETFVSGDDVASTYLAGFPPASHRVGKGKDGECEALPRSDVKSLSIASDGSILYLQANWESSYSKTLNIIEWQEHRFLCLGVDAYRARWFTKLRHWRRAV